MTTKTSEPAPVTNPARTPGGPNGRMGPGFTGPKDGKVPPITTQELGLIVGIVIAVGFLILGYWFYGQREGTGKTSFQVGIGTHEKPAVKSPTPVSSGPLTTPAVAAATPTSPERTPAAMKPKPVHADIYFDFDRSRLRADAVSILQEQAQLLKKDSGWVVMVQGHSDQNGPAEYNKVLAKRRAETVKEFLVQLGVPESSIKVLGLGQEGMICDDDSQECRKLNRRVHLEMTKLETPPTPLPGVGGEKSEGADESTTPSSPTH
jgi:peptidoglycan-associated lipoprotein